MKIKIMNRDQKTVIFEHEDENNTIALTVVAAIKAKVSLSHAYLSMANLSEMDLNYADFSFADLSFADLSGTNLWRTNLRYADLSNAAILGANLYETRLIGADLFGYHLHSNPLIINGFKWYILITNHLMKIGCQLHTHEEWENFTDREIAEMDDDALEFWHGHKTILIALCKTQKDASND